MRRICILAAIVLAACGGGEAEDESPPSPPLQTFENCRYEFIPPGGFAGGFYVYRCRNVTQCDSSDPCTNEFVQRFNPECVIGRTTCTTCPPGHIFC